MIKFQQNDPGLDRIASIIARNNFPKLPDTLYVFGANENRQALIYISPAIPDSLRIANFITQQTGRDVYPEPIGNPPQKNWVAFNRKVREHDPISCAQVCLFVERAIHNLIIW